MLACHYLFLVSIAPRTVGEKSTAGFGLPHLAANTCHLISVLGRLGLAWPLLRIIEAQLSLQLREFLEQNKIPFIVYL
jgi:hypothetical protein